MAPCFSGSVDTKVDMDAVLSHGRMLMGNGQKSLIGLTPAFLQNVASSSHGAILYKKPHPRYLECGFIVTPTESLFYGNL